MKTKVVMCSSSWPEGDDDFVVFDVLSGESDEDAIKRAQEVYSSSHEFYVTYRLLG